MIIDTFSRDHLFKRYTCSTLCLLMSSSVGGLPGVLLVLPIAGVLFVLPKAGVLFVLPIGGVLLVLPTLVLSRGETLHRLPRLQFVFVYFLEA